MKTGIAWGALLVAVVIVALRPAPAQVLAPERRVEVPIRVEVPVEVPVEVTKVAERVPGEPRTPERQRSASPPAGRVMTPADLAHEKMLFLFERGLDLRGDQRRFMEDVLARRELVIAEVQREMAASGVLRLREYDDRIKALMAASYDKMKEVLDEPQRSRFAALLAEGRLGDGAQFALPTNVIVLDD